MLSMPKKNLILWVLSKFESKNSLDLAPVRVQQGSTSVWFVAAAKPSLIFKHVEASSEFSYKQRPQPPKLAECYAVIKLQSS